MEEGRQRKEREVLSWRKREKKIRG